MVFFWYAGLALLVGSTVVTLLGLGGRRLAVSTLDAELDSDMESGRTWTINGPSSAEAAAWSNDQRRRLRFTILGVLLANVGGALSAFGAQPWGQ